LGYFIEIKTSKSKENYIEIVKMTNNIIKKLNLDLKDIESKRYAQLILNKDAK